MIDQVIESFKGIGVALIGGIILYGGFWIKRVFDQKKRNDINEVDLTLKKINLDNQSKPIDDLVAASNKSHGVTDEMVKPTGSDDKKE